MDTTTISAVTAAAPSEVERAIILAPWRGWSPASVLSMTGGSLSLEL
jgi:hypothetical protein